MTSTFTPYKSPKPHLPYPPMLQILLQTVFPHHSWHPTPAPIYLHILNEYSIFIKIIFFLCLTTSSVTSTATLTNLKLNFKSRGTLKNKGYTLIPQQENNTSCEFEQFVEINGGNSSLRSTMFRHGVRARPIARASSAIQAGSAGTCGLQGVIRLRSAISYDLICKFLTRT